MPLSMLELQDIRVAAFAEDVPLDGATMCQWSREEAVAYFEGGGSPAKDQQSLQGRAHEAHEMCAFSLNDEDSPQPRARPDLGTTNSVTASIEVVLKQGFQASATFDGPQAGFAFKNGPHGLGYYPDAPAGLRRMAKADVVTGEPSLRSLYHFATTCDLILIVLAMFLYLAVGVANCYMQILIGRTLNVEEPPLVRAGEQALLYLGLYLGVPTLGVNLVGALCALSTRHAMTARWRLAYMRAVLRQDVGWYDVNQATQLAQRMSESMVHIDQAFSLQTYNGLMPLGMMFASIVIAFVVTPSLAGVTVGIALGLVIPASLLFARTIVSRTRKLGDAYGEAGGFAAETLAAIRTVASLGLERYVMERYGKLLAHAEVVALSTSSKLALSTSTLSAFTFYLSGTASLFVLSQILQPMRDTMFAFASSINVSFCVPTACEKPHNTMLFSQILATNFSAAVAVGNSSCFAGTEHLLATCASGARLDDLVARTPLPAGLVSDAFRAAGSSWPCGNMDFESTFISITTVFFGFITLPQVPLAVSALLQGMTAAHSCLQLIHREPTIDVFSSEGRHCDDLTGLIEMKDVHFSYPAAPSFHILNGFSLTIPAGTSCALVGPSGCGKSTTVHLLERFYDALEGGVLLGGHDVKTLNVTSLRSRLGLVAQEPQLFSGSIADNIRYGMKDATQEEVEEAARMANAHDFIMNDLSTAGGYEMQVGSSNLSGGQKQRVAIARALLKQPAVLLLDEATSALDTLSEKAVQAALDTITKTASSTHVIIAHRLSTVRDCDALAVVNKGRVVEKGTYDELMAIGEGGLFYSLAATQDEDEEPADENYVAAESSSVSERSFAPERSTSIKDLESGGDGAPSQSKKKAKKKKGEKEKSLSNKVWALYGPAERPWLYAGLLGATLCGVASGCMGVVIVKATFPFMDVRDPDELSQQVILWGTVSIGIGAATHLVELGYKWSMAIAAEGLTRRLRLLVMERLIQQEIGYFDEKENSVGDLTEFLAKKVLLVQTVAQGDTQNSIFFLGTCITAIVMSVVFGDWRLLLVFFALFPVSVSLTGMGFALTGSLPENQNAGPSDPGDESLRSAGAIVGEVTTAIATVASCTAEDRFLNEYSSMVMKAKAQATGPKMYLGSALVGVGQAGTMISSAFIIWYGFWLMDNDMGSFLGNSSPNCPIPIVDVGRIMVPMYSIMAFFLQLGAIASLATNAKEAAQAAKALFTRIERPSQRSPFAEGGETLPKVAGTITLVDVTFAYPTRPDVNVFRRFNLVIHAGDVCAIIGQSGSGKSTVVSLLLRFYDPQAGQVALDGKDICTLNLMWLRRQIGFVGQEPVLFLGTVKENIAHGKEGATQAEIEEAARLANAHNFITKDLGSAYNTQVGVRGSQLSGGQKQRIAIARALVRQPAIMLLDEATSALDNESEKVVLAALDDVIEHRSQMTTIMIAHRLSTIRKADNIAVVKKGKVVESGTHTELQAMHGLYFQMLNAA